MRLASGNSQTVQMSRTIPQPSGKVTSSMKMKVATCKELDRTLHHLQKAHLQNKQLLPDSSPHRTPRGLHIPNGKEVEVERYEDHHNNIAEGDGKDLLLGPVSKRELRPTCAELLSAQADFFPQGGKVGLRSIHDGGLECGRCGDLGWRRR